MKSWSKSEKLLSYVNAIAALGLSGRYVMTGYQEIRRSDVRMMIPNKKPDSLRWQTVGGVKAAIKLRDIEQLSSWSLLEGAGWMFLDEIL